MYLIAVENIVNTVLPSSCRRSVVVLIVNDQKSDCVAHTVHGPPS